MGEIMKKISLYSTQRTPTPLSHFLNLNRIYSVTLCFILSLFYALPLHATTLTYTLALPNIWTDNGGYSEFDSTLTTWVDDIGDTLIFSITLDDSLTPAFFTTPITLQTHTYMPDNIMYSINAGYYERSFIAGWSRVVLQSYGDNWNTLSISAYFDGEQGPGYYGMGFERQSNGNQYGFVDVFDQYVDLSSGVPVSYGKNGSSTVPEPATMLLLGLGLVGLVDVKRKLKN